MKFLVFLVEGKAGLEIVPVFISVDPERDTVEQVHDYIKGTVPYSRLFTKPTRFNITLKIHVINHVFCICFFYFYTSTKCLIENGASCLIMQNSTQI